MMTGRNHHADLAEKVAGKVCYHLMPTHISVLGLMTRG